MDQTGLGEVRPFGVSTEFEMGMYPPGQGPPAGGHNDHEIKIVPMHAHPNAPEMTLHSSPNKIERKATGANTKNSKSGNRNI